MKTVTKYIGAWLIIAALEYIFGFINRGPITKSEYYIAIVAISVLLFPLIWVKQANAKKGLILFVVSYLAFGLIIPTIFNYIRDLTYPVSERYMEYNDDSNQGTYFIDNGEIIAKLIVVKDKWQCNISIKGQGGYVVTDQLTGYIRDYLIIDGTQHIPIGELNGNSSSITVYNRQLTLTKI